MSSSSSTMGANNSVSSKENLVREILRRVPTKSLMAWKCVSKNWYKIIRDPVFTKSHIGGFHGLLIAHHTHEFGFHVVKSLANDFFTKAGWFINDDDKIKRTSNFPGCSQLLLPEKYKHYCDYKVTNIEKGLCVLYKDCEFILFNIATHEMLDLPIKSLDPQNCTSICYLGFDPVRGVYKLVRFSYDGECRNYLHICTIGGEEDSDLEWRSIGGATELTHFGPTVMRNVCVNGVLYLTRGRVVGQVVDDTGVVIDIHSSEPLAAIDLSNEMAPQFLPFPDKFMGNFEIVQLGESPAVIEEVFESGVIWMLKDNRTWTKTRAMNLRGLCFYDLECLGTLPTGDLLLAPRNVPKHKKMQIYKYDHIRNKLLDWLEFDIPYYDWLNGEACHLCYHEDNIVPLESLISRPSGSSSTTSS